MKQPSNILKNLELIFAERKEGTMQRFMSQSTKARKGVTRGWFSKKELKTKLANQLSEVLTKTRKGLGTVFLELWVQIENPPAVLSFPPTVIGFSPCNKPPVSRRNNQPATFIHTAITTRGAQSLISRGNVTNNLR